MRIGPRWSVIPAVLAAGCSAPSPDAESVAVEEARDAAAPAGPDVAVSVAPGVAFTYRYSYRLPDAAVSGVMERHAAACEKLGLARCRITGLRYTIVDEQQVSASLDLALDPAIARGFGKEATGAVEQADGLLVDAEIGGADVGTGIDDSQRRSGDLEAEIARIEAQLAAPGLADSERAGMRQAVERMREQLRAESSRRSDDRRTLAITPMHLAYQGGDGPLGRNPLREAWRNAGGSFAVMAGVVLTLLAVLLPWAGLALLVWLLWRSPLFGCARRWQVRMAERARPGRRDP